MVSLFELSRLATALGGLPIPGCDRGSPADRARLRYGDILLSINEMPTASWADFFHARRRSSGPLRVRVFRLGRELEVQMTLPVHTRCPREVLENCKHAESGAAFIDDRAHRQSDEVLA
jgi:S1-C subfamily serine protease